MAIPDENKTTYEQEKAAIERLTNVSGLPRDFVIWYLHFHQNDSALGLLQKTGGAGEGMSEADQYSDAAKYLKTQRKDLDAPFKEWMAAKAAQGPSRGESAEAVGQGLNVNVPGPDVDPWLWMYKGLNIGRMQQEAGGTTDKTGTGGGLIGAVGDVFSSLTPEQLDGLGVEQISEKFGLQRLAIEDPEAFLQAMFDKSGIVASPPVYGFLRDLMPSITLLASTKQGQDIINSPGGAVQLNKAINEVISQGYPSAGSILEGLTKMGGLARSFLGEGSSDEPRREFSFIAATLNDLIGPTMAQPLRAALFNTKAIETQGDRFLSAAARGMYKGNFIDWLKEQGYPLPALPAYTPTAGANFVDEAVSGGGAGVSSSGASTFQIEGGVYKGE